MVFFCCSGMGPDFRVLVRKSRKQAEQYHRLYKVNLLIIFFHPFAFFCTILLPHEFIMWFLFFIFCIKLWSCLHNLGISLIQWRENFMAIMQNPFDAYTITQMLDFSCFFICRNQSLSHNSWGKLQLLCRSSLNLGNLHIN